MKDDSGDGQKQGELRESGGCLGRPAGEGSRLVCLVS